VSSSSLIMGLLVCLLLSGPPRSGQPGPGDAGHPRSGRGGAGAGGLSPQWGLILDSLSELLSVLKAVHVPSFLVRKLLTQIFSFTNVQLFNRSAQGLAYMRSKGKEPHSCVAADAVGAAVAHPRFRTFNPPYVAIVELE